MKKMGEKNFRVHRKAEIISFLLLRKFIRSPIFKYSSQFMSFATSPVSTVSALILSLPLNFLMLTRALEMFLEQPLIVFQASSFLIA